MSGVLRLSNNVTGRSTIIASASNDQTFTLPATGGTLLAGGSSLEVIFPSGTEALPGLHVESDVNTGLYSPAANTLGISTDGTEAMRIDSSGRVGIGTSTPASILHCASSGDDNIRVVANGKTAQLGVDGGTPFVGTPSGAFNFYANGNLAATLDSSGRLLVGTSSTNGSFNSAIQIAGSGVAGTQLISRFDNNAGAPNLYFAKSRGASVGTNTLVQSGDEVGNIGFYAADGTNYVPAAQIRVDVDGTPGTSDMPGRLVFSTTADGASSPTERLRIDSSGNVGIGNTTCGSILDVRTGAAGSQNAITMGYGRSANPTDAIHKIQWASDDLVIAADTGNTITSNIIFKNDNTERMRIDSSGRVGIGTTPSRKLHVFDNASVINTVAIEATNSSSTSGAVIFADYYAPNTSNITFIQFNADQAGTPEEVFRVDGVGDVKNRNNSYGPLASDERLKQDITDANSQWDDIKNIRITNFHYKNDPAGPLQLGPIAQELEKVSPGLITRRLASEDDVADPSNGLVDGDEVLSFKASILYMKAVKALQEAMERIESLETEVALLRSN
jgi:hypothetical protein